MTINDVGKVGVQGNHARTDPAHAHTLMTLIAQGNQAAFTDLYQLMSKRVFGLVLHILRDRAQSEEVMQEIFLEIWRQAPRYEPSRGQVTTWILTISHRRAVDRVRASESSIQRDIKDGLRTSAIVYDDVEEKAIIKEEARGVHGAMQRLTEIQRQAVELIYYSGYSQKEVAQSLRIPVNTVKTRLRDALIRLRDELGVTV